MYFITIDARERRVMRENYASLADAQEIMGLKNVDLGTASPGIGIIVSEFGLFEPVDKQHYFAIGNTLYGGNAVLYRYDESGATVDVGPIPNMTFFYGIEPIEAAIKSGEIRRPQIKCDGEVIWSWPDLAPEGFGP
jgi:hypothetical protein